MATMGPAVADLESVRWLVRAGMDVARLNFSHGDHDSHIRMIKWIRQAAAEVGRSIAILQDIQAISAGARSSCRRGRGFALR